MPFDQFSFVMEEVYPAALLVALGFSDTRLDHFLNQSGRHWLA